MDGGSNPPSSTKLKNQLVRQLAFFCLLPRVYAGSCGLLRTSEPGISAANRWVFSPFLRSLSAPVLSKKARSPEDWLRNSI